jgi:MOSC domain-containing protein YiiM
VAPGQLGENVTVRGLDLLALPTGSRLHLGDDAVVVLTGLRNPCVQLDRFADGLVQAVLRREDDGSLSRLAGVMAVVERGGPVRPADRVRVARPDGEPVPLAPV